MKKVEKFLKHISKLETGSAPSVEYFEQIILEAREALKEFEQLCQYNVVGRSEQLVCDRCNGEHNNITPCPKCGGLSESLFEAN